jgi:hypothetical protein
MLNFFKGYPTSLYNGARIYRNDQSAFQEYYSLYREGKIPIVQKDGESFIDLEALQALQAKQLAEKEPS